MKMVASVLLLLALVALLATYRNGLTVDQAAETGVGVVVRVKDDALYNEYRTVAVLALIAIFAFVIWTVLRANKVENKVMPPARESSSSNKTALH